MEPIEKVLDLLSDDSVDISTVEFSDHEDEEGEIDG